MSKFNRTKFYDQNNIGGNDECDFLRSDISNFEIKRPTTFYTIREEDIQRPELLSYKLYNNQDYWYLLMYINNIHDIWNDLTVGLIIKVPNVRDITEWYLNTRK